MEVKMKKVLVVDDTKNIRLLLTKCLELEGFEVMTANDGRQALELLREYHFDLVFLDIKLPEIRGTEVLKKIRESGIKVPVIIITAYATVKNAVDCTNLGAVAYIQKPFTAEKIRTVLAEFYNRQNIIEDRAGDISEIEHVEIMLVKGLYKEALEILSKLPAAKLENPYLFKLLGMANEGIGNLEQAKKFFRIYEILIANSTIPG
jgi:two-component system, OmpR family, response regulator